LRNSTGASATTIKCALDAIRHVLDVAVEVGQVYANPARNLSVTAAAKKLLKAARRERASQADLRLPTREEFQQLVRAIDQAAVSDCKAAAEYVQLIAYSDARKNEALHVLWSDVDFARKRIHLRVTKNGEPRYVPMIEELHALERRAGSTSRRCARAAHQGGAGVYEVGVQTIGHSPFHDPRIAASLRDRVPRSRGRCAYRGRLARA
jgi:integrase